MVAAAHPREGAAADALAQAAADAFGVVSASPARTVDSDLDAVRDAPAETARTVYDVGTFADSTVDARCDRLAPNEPVLDGSLDRLRDLDPDDLRRRARDDAARAERVPIDPARRGTRRCPRPGARGENACANGCERGVGASGSRARIVTLVTRQVAVGCVSALPAATGPSKRTLRVLALALVLVSASPAMATTFGVATGTAEDDGSVPESVPPADGHTVVTVDGIGAGVIAAYAPNGSKVYEADEHNYYHDVDPAPRYGKTTVTYVASHAALPRHCADEDRCRKSKVMRLNVTTGEREELWARYATPSGSNNVHDVDVVNDTHLVVAEISHPDGVYVVNVSSEETVWRWDASEHYDPEADGGEYPGDWTHMNDVEYLDDRGLVMASPRNMDSVVFLRPGEGVVEELTLGSDGDHRTLYEAHNPDFVPGARGGPAVVVADSENDRIVEYQRRDGDWARSWLWRDGNVQWPRDADRLPDGTTLVTDTHADRVVEVAPNGSVVWETRFPGPYEAERLGTGEESAGGPSATQAGLESRRADAGIAGGVALAAERVLPSLLVNGMLFTLPRWMNPVDAVGLVFATGFALVWATGELAVVLRRRRREPATGDDPTADGSTASDDD